MTLSFFVLAVIGFGLVEGIFTGIGVTSRRFFTAREATFNTSCYSGSEGRFLSQRRTRVCVRVCVCVCV